mmetsp:Transcript_25283/g.59181  ORF Transcript_25283/g.59181 Transcript_25283/m.59181 type:complete len:228 (+) Transcript_25283:2130-2813(+)
MRFGFTPIFVNLVQDNSREGIAPKSLQGNISSERCRHYGPGWKIYIHGMKGHGIGIFRVVVDLCLVRLARRGRFRRFALEIDPSHRRGRLAGRCCYERLEERRGWETDVRVLVFAPERIVKGRVETLHQLQDEVAQSVGDEPEFHRIGNFHSREHRSGRFVFELSLELHHHSPFLFRKYSFVPIRVRFGRIRRRSAYYQKTSDEQIAFDRNGRLRVQRKWFVIARER